MSTNVALITGGAQGIGKAIALRLARDGLDVAVNDVPSKSVELKAVSEEVKSLGRRSIALTGDVTKEEDVKQIVGQAVAELGHLNVMVANAGIAPKAPMSIADADISVWESLWAVNIRGVVLSYKYAAQQMIKQGSGGRIIGASSMSAFKAFPGSGDYSISKAAVRSLTQTAALELKDHKITVNAYAPGVVDTPLTRSLFEDLDSEKSTAEAKRALGLSDSETVQAEDVANLVSYLASPGARHVTGQTILIDAGALL